MSEQRPTIYFDLDGTILDVKRRYYAVYSVIVSDLGLTPLALEDFWDRRRRGEPADQTIANVGETVRSKFRQRWLESIETHPYISMDELLPRAAETLTDLSKRFCLVLVTLRRERELLIEQLSTLKIEHFFDTIISPPDKRSISSKATLISQKVRPGSYPALVIGDSEADVSAAKKLGIRSVCVTSGIRERAFLEALDPDFIIGSIAEIPPLLQRADFISPIQCYKSYPALATSEPKGEQMNVLTYLMESRGIGNAARRLPTIAWRFGVSTSKMEKALQTYIQIAQAHNCRPTLAVTSVLLERYPKVFQWLNEQVELGVHGYVHTDYSLLDEKAQGEHMERSLQAFLALGIQPKGFRCPYLRWNEDSISVASKYGLTYGSNRSVVWDVVRPEKTDASAWEAYRKGLRLYGTDEVADYMSLPSRINGSLLDLPASMPDDEAMIDRLGLPVEKRVETWLASFQEAYKRGEMLVTILHHERVPYCAEALEAVLQASRQQQLPVFVASMGEIADWWNRRSSFKLNVERLTEASYRVLAPDDGDATILVSGVQTDPPSQPWDDRYRVAPPGNFTIPTKQAPVISLDEDSPVGLKAFLQEEGFVIWDGLQSGGYRLTGIETFSEKDKRKVLNTIETSGAPLVRLWRWPRLARSALSITGDIDAMTFVDFLRRPFEV